MFNETHTPSRPTSFVGAPSPPSDQDKEIRALRRKGWTTKSLAKRYSRSIAEIERACGPDL